MWGPNVNWSGIFGKSFQGLSVNQGPKPKKPSKPKRGLYRHIEVYDHTDHVNKIRSLTVKCPMEYPGLTEVERRSMYEGLAKVADAYRAADRRCDPKVR